MKRLIIAAALVSIALFGSMALAVPPGVPGENVLGIYSASDGSGFAHLGTGTTPVVGPQPVYLMATGLTDPSGISGWECHVIIPPEAATTLYYTGQVYSGQAINVATAPDFAVGLAASLLPTADDYILLATLNFLVSAPTVVACLKLEPTTIPSIPNSMVYALGSDPGQLRAFAWNTPGEETGEVFCFNRLPDPTIAVETETWGAVKNLYR